MKIRQGFVSNSSSSSFCIIGVSSGWADKLFTAEGLDKVYICDFNDGEDEGKEYFSGEAAGKVVTFFGSEEPYYAGLDAEKLLEKMTIPEAKKHFQQMVLDKLAVKIPLNDIRFIYGEVSTG